MKQTKSDIVVTKFGRLVHSLNKDYRLHEIIGVRAKSEDKCNAEIKFKYIHSALK